MKAIVFTKNALFHLSQFSITKEWFKGFDLPENIENIIKIYKGGLRNEVYNPTYVVGILEYLYENGLTKY